MLRFQTDDPQEIRSSVGIQRPLLVIEGGNDPRTSQATELVATLDARGVAVTHVVFRDEELIFERPVNRIASVSVIDAFLAQCFGGRYEPCGARGSSGPS